MPYSTEHKKQSREKIVESARILFNRFGFQDVTIDMVMKHAGLTRGGFYNHFKNKEALYAAAVSSFLAGRGIGGIYHFSGEPETSWAGFSREIFKQAGLNVTVKDIPTSQYPTPAKRPLNSRLDCSDILRDYGLKRPDWRQDLADVLCELDEQS